MYYYSETRYSPSSSFVNAYERLKYSEGMAGMRSCDISQNIFAIRLIKILRQRVCVIWWIVDDF